MPFAFYAFLISYLFNLQAKLCVDERFTYIFNVFFSFFLLLQAQDGSEWREKVKNEIYFVLNLMFGED